MKYAIAISLATLFLTGCGNTCQSLSDGNLGLIRPDIKIYHQSVLNKAADEIDSGKCPVLGEIMMPDYQICRDQSREIK